MNTEQLKTFLSLLETENFSRAAKDLLIAQSSVSKRISELEKEVGQPLFTRGKGGVRPTVAGKILRGYAEQIINMEGKALEQIHRTNRYAGYLVIGVAFACFELLVSDRLAVFAKENPDISVSIKPEHTGKLFSELIKSSVDIIFTHRPFQYPEYICSCVGEDEVILVSGRNTGTQPDRISFFQIKDLPIIDTNFLYAPTRRQLFPQPYQSQIQVDVASFAIPLLLQSSCWYALLPRKQILPYLQSGELREIPVYGGKVPPVRHYIVYRKGTEQKEGVSSLLSMIHPYPDKKETPRFCEI